MSALNYAFSELEFEIPPDLLKAGFGPMYPGDLTTAQSRIQQLVINDRVRKVIDAQGVSTKTIMLDDEPHEYIDEYFRTYDIRHETRGGLNIVDVQEVMYLAYGSMHGLQLNSQFSGEKHDRLAMMIRAASRMSAEGTNCVKLVAPNKILVTDGLFHRNSLILNCTMSSDQAFNSIPTSLYSDFAELVTLATKAWLYKEFRVTPSRAAIHGGVPLDEFSSALNDYSSASQDFKEKAKGWKKSRILSDPESRRQHIRTLVGVL